MKRRAVLFGLLAAAVVLAAWRIGAPSSGKAAAGQPSGSLSFEEEGFSTGATASAPGVNNLLSYELADAAISCEAVDSVTISYRDGSSDTIPDEMIGWGWDSPEDDVQLAGHDVDTEPPAPPPDPKPPRC